MRKCAPPFDCWCKHAMTKKAKKAPNVMLTPKNTQKPRPAAIAHLDELLDEALKETFPASIQSQSILSLNQPSEE